MAKRYSIEEKKRILSAFQERSESAAQFSDRNGLSVGSLYRWQQELGTGFQEVVPPDIPLKHEGVQLSLVIGGAKLDFLTLPPESYLVELLSGLDLC